MAVVAVTAAPLGPLVPSPDGEVVDALVTDVSGEAEVDVVSAGGAEVDDAALFSSDEPDEHATVLMARTRTRMRRFTGAHPRGGPPPSWAPFRRP